jgi:protein-disulfide isomerase
VFASNVALEYRAAERQANLLGRPLAPAKPASAVSPGSVAAGTPALETPPIPAQKPENAAGPQDAKYWREHAQKLQETLDDPRKLETYFSEKAQREFAAAQPVSIDLASAASRGPATAPVKVVEYSDFLCPFCRNLGQAFAQFVPQAGGRVVVYFKNYPLDSACNPKLKQSVHPGACNLALGAICAQRQGKFEAYHDRVFGTEFHNPQAADVVRIAGEAGLNAAAMPGCLDDPKTKEALDAQIAEANRLAITSTPTVYINGKKLPRINDFVAVIDTEARKKGFPPLPK